MLNQRSPRAIMAQIIKQIICIGMTLVVILPILLTVFAFNVMGDGLRDALDPRLKQ